MKLFFFSPSLPQAYYRLGVALQGLERYEEAMVAFAEGLAADPKQAQMLSGLTETVLKSPLRGRCVVVICTPVDRLSGSPSTAISPL